MATSAASSTTNDERGWLPTTDAYPVVAQAAAPTGPTKAAVTSTTNAASPAAAVSTNGNAQPAPDRRCYWAVALEKDAAHLLNRYVTQLVAGRSDLTVKDEFHCTLLFMGRDRSKEGPILAANGAKTTLTLRRVVVTPRLACALVSIDDEKIAAMCSNEHPHITLALGPKVPAKESNDALNLAAKDPAAAAAAGYLVLDPPPQMDGLPLGFAGFIKAA
jgi:2'-5' RNA ligase